MINTSNSILMMWPQLLTVLIQTPTVLQTKARQSCRREVVRIAFVVTVWLYVSQRNYKQFCRVWLREGSVNWALVQPSTVVCHSERPPL